ncbi:MAG: heterodisulfide reductase-related iron-sulfur binding cluster, partial [Anaerovoracaceae bacterium]
DPALFLDEFAYQFQFESYDLQLNTTISSLEDLASFDGVYLATGKGGEDFGLCKENPTQPCMQLGTTGVFAGGGLLGHSPDLALRDGLLMSTTIDNFLKTGNLLYTPAPSPTKMVLDSSHLCQGEKKVPPSHQSPVEAAINEAARCLRCQCDACKLYCDLVDYQQKWPLRLRDEIQATTLPGFSEVKATPAKRLISTCTQCGLCKETCPEDIDLGGLILAARKSMHRQGKTPWVFHEFWLRDMDFANAPLCHLAKKPAEGSCSYAFFPGCQLTAALPDVVEKTFAHLHQQLSHCGILLGCCGIPAEWAGDEEKHQQELSTLEQHWNALGKPTLILACPTCHQYFSKHLPHIQVRFLSEVLDSLPLPQKLEACTSSEKAPEKPSAEETKSFCKDTPLAVFHPCSTRQQPELRQSVLSLARKAGYTTAPLPLQDNYSACCSYGGQGAIADPEFAQFTIQKRTAQSPLPYLTYCSNCRDAFLEEGKPAVHLLELLFGESTEQEPTLTRRRENRIRLKETLQATYWEALPPKQEATLPFALLISPPLQLKLSKNRILEEDVAQVILFCQETGRTVYNPDTETYSGYRQIGNMTTWVEYKQGEKAASTEETFILVNAYTHRMKIELEAVWNGYKTKIEV